MKKTDSDNNKKKKISAKTIGIVTGYLEDANPGLRVIRDDFEDMPFVAKEGDQLVFIKVAVSEKSRDGLPEPATTRQEFEMAAIRYLAATNEPSAHVRFDTVSIVYVKGEKVFLRHHKDAMATD
jgi:Holliday junction resolvase-like predicted endonuclease